VDDEFDGVNQLQVPPNVFAGRRTKQPRGVCPAGTIGVTIGVDCQQDVLFWAAVAWNQDGGGSIVDYGTTPDQKLVTFNLRTLRQTLRMKFPGTEIKGGIRAGLDLLFQKQMAREWVDVGGAPVTLERLVVDSNFEADTVYNAVTESGHKGVIIPAHGRGITANNKPFSLYDREFGVVIGEEWRFLRMSKRSGAPMALQWNTNYWKTETYRRLTTPIGDDGALSIFGEDRFPHILIEHHLSAEQAERKHGNVATCFEWKLPSNQPDNHWWDALLMASVGASHAAILVNKHVPTRETTKDRDALDVATAEGFHVADGHWS
jgi:hypothetical protein